MADRHGRQQVIAVAYLLISAAIVIPLARSNQLRTNPLGAATAAIFFTWCRPPRDARGAHADADLHRG